ncbi:MAG: DUF3857 domain-containing protein [Bacteroidales bacterium]|nr:DUF3857 domain-containing protein [Bacteroidales bacterium]
MKKILLLVIAFVIVSKSSGFTEKAPLKWGKVSVSEFEINSFRGDKNVPAIILCDYGNIRTSYRTFYTRHVRIKINNEKGLKYARIEIPFKYKEKHDDITVAKANVYTMKDGSVLKYQYKINDAKTEIIDNEWRKLVFDLEPAEPGSVIEYYYEMASLDFVKLDTWYFQSEIPTLWSEVRFDVTHPFHYLVTFQQGEFLSRDEQANFAEKLQWLYDANRFERRGQMAKQKNVLYESPSKNYRIYLMNNMKKKIVMKNLPGVTNIDGFVSVKDYYPRLKFDLFESSGNLPYFYRPLLLTATEDYDTKSRRQWMISNRASGFIHYRLASWMDFNTKLLANERFGKRLIKFYNYLPVLEKNINDNMAPVEKMQNLFRYAQDSLTWNGKYSMYADRDLNKAKEAGELTSGEINLSLIYLLRKAGLDADPLLVRTTDLGLPQTLYPVPDQFNHVIAVVTVGDEMYLLDAANKENAFGRLAPELLNTTGWRVDKDNFGWIDISPL